MGYKFSKRINKEHRSRVLTFILALLLALVLHIAFFYLAKNFIAANEVEEKPIKVRPISLHREKTVIPHKKTPQPIVPPKKVVSIPKEPTQIRPEKADFLAEHDSSTDKQTLSKNRSLKPQQDQGQQKARDKTNEQRPDNNRIDNNQHSGPGANDLIKVPSWKELGGGVEANNFADELEGVEEGSKTSLNAWQWKHAAFFNRIKERVASQWSPNTQIRRHDPQGKAIGGQDRVTVLSVSIDKDGKIVDIQVLNSCGLAFLDDEAVRSFRVAAPFAHPPSQLFENDELFTFQFGFHLSMQKGFSFGFR